jgi:regulator of protease activity HflC (stomatin/prohibitin superfamily)
MIWNKAGIFMEEKASLSNWKLVFVLTAVGCTSLICIAVVIALFRGGQIFIFIQPDERAIIISPYESSGYSKEILTLGPHLIKPGESAVIYNIGKQAYMATSKQIFTETKNFSFGDILPVKSRDGLAFSIGLKVIYRIDPNRILDLYINWKDHYPNDVVEPQVRDITRDVIAENKGVELSTKRAELATAIRRQLETIFSENYLILDDFEFLYIEPAQQ